MVNLKVKVTTSKRGVKIKKPFKKGFTLIELIIAIALLAILVTAAIMFFGGRASDEAKITKLQSTINSVENAIQKYKADVGMYPSEIKELWQDADSQGNPIPNWNGPYLTPKLTKNNEIWLKEIGTDTLLDVSCSAGTNGEEDIVIKGIPPTLAAAYDKKFDDGNTATGNAIYDSSNNELKVKVATAQFEYGGQIYCTP